MTQGAARAWLWGLLAWGALYATAYALPERSSVEVARTTSFVFYSDALINLHDFLVWNARSRESVEPAAECLARQAAIPRAAFAAALAHYQVFARPSGDRLLLALRYRLAGYGDLGLADPAAVEAAMERLAPAATVYAHCWWPAHDARNRRWIAQLQPLLDTHGPALHARLATLYGKAPARPLPVDVVGYGSFSGADSVTDPDHLLVSSLRPSNQGHAALEIVFHEASHTLFGPRIEGPLWQALQAAARDRHVTLPADFWHALLFRTTGDAVRAQLSTVGIDYLPYIDSQGLFERSWGGFRTPLERHWQPYLDGKLSRADALSRLVEAFAAGR